ncbi:MAG: Dabb family protein [Mailhella sp.]|nr:Dabb family protein [Mailhella sp.]
MLRHIVWWTLADQADGHSAAENAVRVKEASEALKAIPAALNVEVSYDILPTSTVPARVVLQSAHKGEADLKEYAGDPVHLEFLKLIKSVSASRQALDYVIE